MLIAWVIFLACFLITLLTSLFLQSFYSFTIECNTLSWTVRSPLLFGKIPKLLDHFLERRRSSRRSCKADSSPCTDRFNRTWILSLTYSGFHFFFWSHKAGMVKLGTPQPECLDWSKELHLFVSDHHIEDSLLHREKLDFPEPGCFLWYFRLFSKNWKAWGKIIVSKERKRSDKCWYVYAFILAL